jgi:hypothetical protein
MSKQSHRDNTVSDARWREVQYGLGATLAAKAHVDAKAQHRSICDQQKAAKQGRN